MRKWKKNSKPEGKSTMKLQRLIPSVSQGASLSRGLMLGIYLLFSSYAATLPPLESLGRTTKLRILVDKVMQPVAGWHTEEWMIRATAQAGFNVYCPRIGYDRPKELRQVAQWCKKYGIYFMPWMRGTLPAPQDASAAGRRLVWANGVEQPLWSPNPDELWKWMEHYVVQYARLSREIPSVLGVFFDFENYAPGRVRNAYSLSYDDWTLQRFAQEKGISIPSLPFQQRAKWLKTHRLHAAFETFQIRLWREHCRALRQAVDRINPRFRFCVYPAPGTPFIQQAIYPEWATAQAPLLLADASTYGRPSNTLPQSVALQKNRKKLLQNRKIPEKAGIPFLYLGGIDPVVHGADPEFCGKNAVAISDCVDGYWVFYEGPKYQEDHPHYWRWFTWANRMIQQGHLDAWKQPRVEPETWFDRLFAKVRPLLSTIQAPRTQIGAPITYPTVQLRGPHVLLFPAQQGQTIQIRLRLHRVGHYTDGLVWELQSPDWKILRQGKAPLAQKKATIQFSASRSGLYKLAVDAGSNAWSVPSANVPLGVVCSEGLHLIHGPYQLYFTLPPGASSFRITFSGEGTETVHLRVLDPQNHVVAEGETSPQKNTATVQIHPTPTNRAGPWTLETTKASSGILEDYFLRFAGGICPVLSFHREAVFQKRVRNSEAGKPAPAASH